jgi:uncharacterized protein
MMFLSMITEFVINACVYILCIMYNIDKSHGLGHARAVAKNAKKAMECWTTTLTTSVQLLIIAAALLHDVDDTKYFPENKNNENARFILFVCFFSNDDVKTIIDMINLVSASKNKDSVPENLPSWFLIPRYADRLEAIGIIGLERTFEYTKKKNQPMFLLETKRAKTIEEMYSIATDERYEQYTGNSVSMVDHIYDKLLHLGRFPIKNFYFDSECKKKMKPLVNFVLEFGRKKEMSDEEIESFIKNCA